MPPGLQLKPQALHGPMLKVAAVGTERHLIPVAAELKPLVSAHMDHRGRRGSQLERERESQDGGLARSTSRMPNPCSFFRRMAQPGVGIGEMAGGRVKEALAAFHYSRGRPKGYTNTSGVGMAALAMELRAGRERLPEPSSSPRW